MAHLSNVATGLAFDLSLQGWKDLPSKRHTAEQWLQARISFVDTGDPFVDTGDLPVDDNLFFICHLLGSDVEALRLSLHELLSGALTEIGYSPFEPAFRLIIGPSAISGFVVPEPWSATITMDISFLRHRAATGSGPALTLILDAPALLRFSKELDEEYRNLLFI